MDEHRPAGAAAATKDGLSAVKLELLERLRAGWAAATPVQRTIAALGRLGPTRLSFSQERVWLASQLARDVPLFNLGAAGRLTGHLDVDALERRLDFLTRRHDILRTRVRVLEGEPFQVVEPAVEARIRVLDVRPAAGQDPGDAAAEVALRLAREPYRLDTAPLWRVAVLRLPAGNVLVVCAHHLVADGQSLAMIVRELVSEATPPPLALQYADYAAWQRAQLEAGAFDGELGFWRRHLADLPGPLELPGDRRRPPTPSYRGRVIKAAVPDPLARHLVALGRQEGATPFMVLLAAFDVLLHRSTGREDLIVGLDVSGRTLPELRPLVGMLVNVVPLRTSLAGRPSFRTLLGRVRASTIEALTHANIPFERLVAELRRGWDRSHPPLVQIGFTMPTHDEELAAEQLPLPIAADGAQLDLTLHVMPDGRGSFELMWEYASDLFEAATVHRIAGHFLTLLDGALADPDRPVGDISMLDEGERDQVLVRWNRIGAEGQAGRAHANADRDADGGVGGACLHELFERQARRSAAAVAVVCGDRQITYAELDSRANRLARHLAALGVGPDSLVALCLPREVEMVVALLAVHKSGGAYVPLDPAHPPARLGVVVGDAGARVLLTTAALADRVPAGGHAVVRLDDHRLLQAYEGTSPGVDVHLDNLAYAIHTSGSAGRPKGVLITHRGIRNRVLWTVRRHRLTLPDRVLQKTKLTFDAAAWEFFAPLVAGATVVLAPEGAESDPAAMVAAVAAHRVTVLQVVPSTLRLLVDEPGLAGCDALRLVFSAGEQLHAGLCQRLLRAVRVELVNTYGPTECSIDATAWRYDGGSGPVPIGSPIDGTYVRILDRHGQPVPVGVHGELYLGGVGLARGYLGRPDLTAERFVPDAFTAASGRRLYRTGDRARWRPDGAVEFLGRLDDQVKVHGVRIEPGEVEAVLAAHPAVAGVCVTALEDADGDRSLAAYVVPAVGPAVDQDALHEFALARLPAYMLPSRFVTLPSFPLTSSGKIDRRALPIPDSARPRLRNAYLPPRTGTEHAVAAVWAALLGKDQVGVHDDFFQLGGHSLLAPRVVAALRKEFGVDVPLRHLFETPTVAALARVVATATAGTEPALVPVARDGRVPLSFGQQRMWFLDQLEPGSAEYLVPFVLRLGRRLDERAVRRALDQLVARHEILRTTYKVVDGSPAQVVEPPGPVGLAVVRLGASTPAAEVVAAQTGQPFDLSGGPVLRATLLDVAGGEHLLLLVVHHIAFDGWSIGVLGRELRALYEAFAAGRPSPLPPLPVQYADFAAWQRAALAGTRLERDLGFWRRELAGLVPAELPTDHPRPAVRDAAGASLLVEIPAEVGRGVVEVGRAHGATPFMTLLTAFAVLLMRYSGEADLAVGTPVTGRGREELGGLIGFFVNTLVVRCRLAGARSFADALARVRAAALGAFAHQDLPFERLVDELQPDRDPSRTPLFQVMFDLYGAEGSPFPLGTGAADAAPFVEGWQVAKFDLTLGLQQREDGSLVGQLEYATALFDRVTIERLAGHYLRLLVAMVADPGAAPDEVDLATPGERDELRAAWEGTPVQLPDQLFPELVAEHARTTPDAVAVVAGALAVRYGELDARANRLGHELRALGIGPDRIVAICAERGVEMVVAMLAVLKAGGAFTLLDPTHPAERLTWTLQDTDALALLSERERAHPLMELAREIPTLLIDDERGPALGPAGDLGPLAGPDNLAYVTYTSGSTGRPKGVMVTHRSLRAAYQGWAAAYGLGCEIRSHLQVASVSFDVCVGDVARALGSGGRLVICPPDALLDPAALHAILAEHRIDLADLTPMVLRNLVRHLEGSGGSLGSMRAVVVGGDLWTVEDARRLRAVSGPGPRLINTYGVTEATVDNTLFDIAAEGACVGAGPPAARGVPIGLPFPGNTIAVLDAWQRPVPIGVPGQLYVGGAGVARGYLGRPGLTAERFVPDPGGTPGARLYATGDRVRALPGGVIEFLGRLDDQVKVRGFRVEPGEVDALLRGHPQVADTAVVARRGPDRAVWLVGYVVPARQAGEGFGAAVQAWLAARLPGYMLPTVVVVARLPVGANGKVDRPGLARLPDPRPLAGASGGPPRDATEQRVASIWAEVLGVGEVGRDADFFALGGHSLLATRVATRLRSTFGVRLPLRALFQATTVAGLAAVVRTAVEADVSALTDAEVAAEVAALPAEEARG